MSDRTRRTPTRTSGGRSALRLAFLMVMAVVAAAVVQFQGGLPGRADAATCPAGLTYGETADCSISAPGETDVYSFAGTAGDAVIVRLAQTTAGDPWAPQVRLFGTDDLLVDPACQDNAGFGGALAWFECTLESSGTHTLRVTDATGTNAGSYGIHVQRTSDPASATDLPPGTTLAGSIVADAETDAYTFDGTAADVVIVRLAQTTAGDPWAPEARLYGPDGLLVDTLCQDNAGFGGALATFQCTLESTGPHTVLVMDASGTRTGSYGIHNQRTSDPASATDLPPGTTLAGSIVADAETDAYTFDGTAADVVIVRLAQTTAGDPWAPEARLYGPDGLLVDTLCQDNAGFGGALATFQCTLESTGPHTVLVMDASGTRTGSYGIHNQRTSDPASATDLPPGTTLAGSIVADAETDAYTFDGTAADVVIVRLAQTTAGDPWAPEARLYGPDGLLVDTLCQDNAGFGGALATFQCTLESTGPHTVLAMDASGTRTGFYCVSIDEVIPPCPDTDGDGVVDGPDNCLLVANPSQANTDAGNTAANRPGADGLGDACDDDMDGDGYTNAQETTTPLAENPLVYCEIMRADVDGDGSVSILDFAAIAPQFLQSIPPAPERYNQEAGASISILDFAAMASSFLKPVSACP